MSAALEAGYPTDRHRGGVRQRGGGRPRHRRVGRAARGAVRHHQAGHRGPGLPGVAGRLAASLERLGLDYVDLYLIHWPAGEPGKYIDSWGGLMKLPGGWADARSIGVCNFPAEDLSNIIDLSFVPPAINQIELHPLLNQAGAARGQRRARHRHRGLRPAGRRQAAGQPDDRRRSPQAHGKTPAQVLIRWSIQLGNVVIPRSASPERIKSNLDVFDFELTDDEMAALNGLDDGTRFRPDPETYTGT